MKKIVYTGKLAGRKAWRSGGQMVRAEPEPSRQLDFDAFQAAVAPRNSGHTLSAAPCAACGDLDGCHKRQP